MPRIDSVAMADYKDEAMNQTHRTWALNWRSCALIAAAMLVLSGSAAAQGTDWPNEYAKRVRATENISPLTDEAFGDKVNLFNGTVRFSHELISLPGNSSLPVALGIFNDPHDITQGQLNGTTWDLDIPYVGAVHHSKSAEANGWVPIPPNVNNGYVDFDRSMFWAGNRLTINGGGGGDLLKITNDPKRVKPNNSVTYTFATKDGWYFSELPSVQNGPGKGLVGYAPDGTKYTFDWLVYRRYSSITHPWGYTVPNALLHRYKLKLYVTKVEDRFGNWVKYEWEYDHPKRIYSNDGREITMTYSDPVPALFAGNFKTDILSATANGRTWTFSYASSYGGNVTNPDGTEWKYEGPAQFNTFRLDVAEYLLDPRTNQTYLKQDVPCSPGAVLKDTTSRARITHPSGAIAEYVFKSMRHGRTNVPYNCETGFDEGRSQRNRFSTHHDTWSLIEKHVSGPGVPEKVYRYQYDGLGEGYQTQDESNWWIGPGWNAKYAPPAPNYKTVTVTEPDGTQNIHTFGRDRDINEGQLFKVETKKAGITYKVVTNAYVSEAEAANQPFPAWMGSNGDDFADVLPNSNRPLKNTTIFQDGATFNRSVSVFDSLARAISISKWSSGTQYDRGRTDVTDYYDNRELWILGQVAREYSLDSGWITSQTTFNAQALPWKRYGTSTLSTIGALSATYEYNPDGTLAMIADGRGNPMWLQNWKRGVPQSIKYADGSSDSAVVDDNGWINSTTDENGFATTYGYDALGRLKSIDYPAGDINSWDRTTFSLERRASSEFGLPVGHWLQSSVSGGKTKNVYLDALYRPLLTHEFDSADFAGTLKATTAAYDEKGRVAFASYPSKQPTASSQGTRTDYDPLGRVVKVRQDSELGVLSTDTEYLPGFQTRTTNPRQQKTITNFLSFDEPSLDSPVAIGHPEGAYTDLNRDLLGAVTSIRRHNLDGSISLTRQYVFDNQHRLCKVIEPETGANITEYDAAGNIAWTASGVLAPASDSCSHDAAAARKVNRTYDVRNRLKTLSFPDGRGDQQWDYYPDGQVKQIVSNNTKDGDAVVNTYEYNKRRLLNRERLQFGTIDWAIGLGYTNNGNLSTHTYPNGQVVAYAPNALGQPRQAGAFATGISYFPNGGMSSFTYGNGIVHTLQQNLRGFAERSRDAGNATVLDDSFDYDSTGNLAAISDGRPGSRGNRTMTYDGLDRLTGVASQMFGSASYSYDVIDNLRTVNVGTTPNASARNHTYLYDQSNRLELVQNTGTAQKVIGLSYDPQGNLENKNGKEFKFDYANRLREATGAESYRYDGYGRRVLASSPVTGNIVSMYDQGGVLRYQRDFRKEKDTAYINLNGSLVARVRTPVAPDVPVVTAPPYTSENSYIVSWTAVTSSGTYELQEQANSGAWSSIYSGGEHSRLVSDRADGTYGYRARACNSAGCGSWSVVATVQKLRPPVSAPTLSAPATALNGQYAVSWSSAGGATDYVLEESTNNGAWNSAYSGAGLSQSFAGKPSGNFSYRVKACNPAGCGPASSVSTVSVLYPPSSAPAISAPSQSNQGSFGVSWAYVATASNYQLEQNALGQGWGLIQDSSAVARTIVGGSTGMYSYRVRACNAAGCGPTSGEATVQVIGPPHTAPTLAVPAVSNSGAFYVTWDAAANATTYQLEESREGASWVLIYQDAPGTLLVGGRGDGRYGYRVRGCNPAGCGPYSASQFIVVDLPPATPVMTLADWLRNTLRGKIVLDTCYVRWTASAKTTRYELQDAGSGTLKYSGTSNQIESASNGQYCALSYAVRACGTGGCSAWSSPPLPTTRRTEPMD